MIVGDGQGAVVSEDMGKLLNQCVIHHGLCCFGYLDKGAAIPNEADAVAPGQLIHDPNNHRGAWIEVPTEPPYRLSVSVHCHNSPLIRRRVRVEEGRPAG